MKNPGIYILTHTGDGMQYVGRDSNLPSRVNYHLRGTDPKCRAIHDAIQKHGRDAFSVEIIQYPGISDEALNAVERWWIRRLQTGSPSGYNLTEGGEGGSLSAETRQKISESAFKRVADGAHHFLGSDFQRKRVADGTHNFLRSGFQRQVQKKRIKEGTHNFIGGDLQRQVNKKRLEDGTHNLLGEKNPSHRRVADGTHNFLDSDFQRQNAHKRLKDGTHHFLNSDFQRQNALHNAHKRLEDGTHHFIGDKNPIKRLSKEGRHPRTIKRKKAEWCYIIALSRFWYEIHDYTLKRRAEFLSKEIPDLSNAEQTYLF